MSSNLFESQAFAGTQRSSRRRRGGRKDPFESLDLWQLLEAAGADDPEVERARLAELLYGSGQKAEAAEQLGVAPAGEREGLLERFFDYSTRLQSAATGAVTGALGMERVRDTWDGGTLFEQPVAETGLTRFIKGLTGEEKYQATDFGALAYDRETASLPERALKSTVGFALDVALDPLTYVSFGGSILGRKGASVAVNRVSRKRFAQTVADMSVDQQKNLVREAVARLGSDPQSLAQNINRRISAMGGDPSVYGGMLREGAETPIERLIQVAADEGVIADLALDSLAGTLSGLYRGLGYGGVRNFLVEGFGELGEQMARSLPNDIRGGLRIRVPFAKDADGAALSYKLFDRPIVPQFMTGLSNQAREWTRTMPFLRSVGNHMSGALGAADRKLASAVFKNQQDLAKRVWGSVDPQSGVISWDSYQNLERLLSDYRLGANTFARHLLTDAAYMRDNYEQGLKLNEAEFRQAFNEIMKRDTPIVSITGYLAPAGPRPVTATDVFGPNVTDVQIKAFEAAAGFQTTLERARSILTEVFDNPDDAFVALEQYWPRMVDIINQSLGERGKAKNLLSRDSYVSLFSREGSVLKWMTPPDIEARYAGVEGAAVFITDPLDALIPYVIGVTRMAEEQKLIKNMLDLGVLVRGDQYTTIKNLTGQDGAMAAAAQFINRTVAGSQSVVSRVANALGVEEAAAAAAPIRSVVEADLVNAAFAGLRFHGKRVFNGYNELTDAALVATRGPDVSRVWTALDGTEVHEVGGAFRVSRGGRHMNAVGSFVDDPADAALFGARADAQRAADSAMQKTRDKQYIDAVSRARDAFFKNLVDDIKALEVSAGYDYSRNVFDVSNIPIKDQEQYFDSIVNIINQYADYGDFATRRVLGDAYKGRGLQLGKVSVGTPDSPELRSFIKQRFEEQNIFAAEGLVDDIRRIFEAQQKPGAFGKWVDSYYRPFYAVQKALMTSQRGPGYVFRNMVGGMWNAYLVGVTSDHWRLAAIVRQAEASAREAAERAHPTDRAAQVAFGAQMFERSLMDQLGPEQGRRMLDAWQAYEMRGAGARTIGARTVGVQATATPTGVIGDFADPVWQQNMSRAQRVAVKITTDTVWARMTGKWARDSEDFLRFGTFLKGVDDFGLDDGGYAAASLVKASQFDYSDLSDFEAGTLRMIVPFYTWSRNNVPLQLRALMSEPGRVNKALRINEALKGAFGEPNPEDEEPLPSFVRERFGWRIRSDLIQGPMGDALAGGLVWGEPLVDVNRLLRAPSGAGQRNPVNLREIANTLNPAVSMLSRVVTGAETATGGRLPTEEEAPVWARFLSRRNSEGERVVNSRLVQTLRDAVPPLGLAERLFPSALGNERYQRRVITSWASTLFGLPVSTLDPYQTGAELRARDYLTGQRLRRAGGEDVSTRVAFVRTLLNAGLSEVDLAMVRGVLTGKGAEATPEDFMQVPIEYMNTDVANQFVRQLYAISLLPEDSRRRAYDRITIRIPEASGRPTISEEVLEELGLLPTDVSQLGRDELLDLLRTYSER